MLAIEFAVGLALLVGLFHPPAWRVGLWGSVVLAASFIAFAVWRTTASVTLPCSCFGTLFQLPSEGSGAVAAVLFVVSINRLARSAPAFDPRPSTSEVETRC